jgi:hypothetical protein
MIEPSGFGAKRTRVVPSLSTTGPPKVLLRRVPALRLFS